MYVEAKTLHGFHHIHRKERNQSANKRAPTLGTSSQILSILNGPLGDDHGLVSGRRSVKHLMQPTMPKVSIG